MALGSLSPVRLDYLGRALPPPPSFSLSLSFSLRRSVRPHHHLLQPSRPPRPLAASSISSYTLLRFYTPFTTSRQRNLCLGLHSSSLFRRSGNGSHRKPGSPLRSPTIPRAPRRALLPLFFPCSPEVRLATSYPKRRKLPVNVISLLIRFSSAVFTQRRSDPLSLRRRVDAASVGITPLLPCTRLRSHL